MLVVCFILIKSRKDVYLAIYYESGTLNMVDLDPDLEVLVPKYVACM